MNYPIYFLERRLDASGVIFADVKRARNVKCYGQFIH
jgi:hypothetical protein